MDDFSDYFDEMYDIDEDGRYIEPESNDLLHLMEIEQRNLLEMERKFFASLGVKNPENTGNPPF